MTAMTDELLSEEDRALFRQMAEGVKPLANNKKINHLPTPKPTIIHKREAMEQRRQAPSHNLHLSDYYINEIQTHSILSYSSHSIPQRRLRELKSGQIPWQSKLDLHGLRPEAAKNALIQFIHREYQSDRRCLLIIHGKGGLKGEPPVLKNLVNHWLPQFPEVLAFYSALAKDGGEGALYLLLKRQKEERN